MLWFLHGLAIRLWAWLLRQGHLCVQVGLFNADGSIASLGPRRWNLVPNVGRQQWALQNYGTSGLAALGFCYCALSIDAVTEGASSTALSSEIATNGLGRVLCSISLPTGAGNQTIIVASWTPSGGSMPSPQKGAMFNASSSGVINHVFGFSQGAVTPAVGQQLVVRGVVTHG